MPGRAVTVSASRYASRTGQIDVLDAAGLELLIVAPELNANAAPLGAIVLGEGALAAAA